MLNIFETEALVLRKIELLDKDSTIILFSKDLGKMVCIAKGIKKITSRRAAHLQTGNIVKINGSIRGDFYYISQSQVVSAFSDIKSSAEKIDILYKYLFILDRILPQQEPEPLLYKEVIRAISGLSRAEKVEKGQMLEFSRLVLEMLGYYDGSADTDFLQEIESIIHEKIPAHVII